MGFVGSYRFLRDKGVKRRKERRFKETGFAQRFPLFIYTYGMFKIHVSAIIFYKSK